MFSQNRGKLSFVARDTRPIRYVHRQPDAVRLVANGGIEGGSNPLVMVKNTWSRPDKSTNEAAQAATPLKVLTAGKSAID
jgi:hypothetical protein